MKKSLTNKINVDVLLLLIVLSLAAFGTAAIYSASSYIAQEQYQGNSQYYLYKQFIRLGLGLLLLFIFTKIDYHELQRIAPAALGISFVLLLYVLAKGELLNGSRRSFVIGGIPFQPSEMAKYALILFLSSFLINKGEKLKDFNDGLLPALIIIVIILFPILLEPDLGTAIIIFFISLVMIFLAGASLYHLTGLGFLAVVAVSIFLKIFAYQKIRVINYLNAIRGISEPPYQIKQSLISFGNGGVFGVGLGNSRQKMHFLPHPFNDFIYSIIGEETGLIGCSLLLILFLAFLWRGLWIAVHAPDKEGQLLAIGITSSVIVYAFFNAGITLNLMPVTGITMPFISYGGSSLIMNFVAMGVLLNISSEHSTARRIGSVISENRKSYSRIKFRKKR